MNEFHKQAAIAGLNKMFAESYFSICTLESILKILGISLSSKDQSAFQCIHCVKWADMTEEFRAMIYDKIMDTVSKGPTLDVEFMATLPALFEGAKQNMRLVR